MSRLLIASNRLPFTFSRSGTTPILSASIGGLASGLKGPHEKSNGLWFGWPGSFLLDDEDYRRACERQLAELRVVPLALSAEELAGYYMGVSNGVLWPVFHYLLERVPLEQPDWSSYRAVNERFAELVASHYREGDSIWIHDYHLMLLPALLRAALPKARIGFFLHIPFPAAEVFRILPWREQLLRGVLGADLIGFHTPSYMRQFISSIIQILGLIPDANSIKLEQRIVKLGAYPMGVDAQVWQAYGQDPQILNEVVTIRDNLSGGKLLLSVDRLDYTKGIPRRLLALERLLEIEPAFIGKIRFLQVAVPSREDDPQYESFAGEVQQLVGRINGRFSTSTSVPIHFLHQGFSQKELAALYLAADLMLVTPLRDGMNLVAKEFVAARVDEDGVLVLSEFAGAASEMGEALLVNPYDIESTARSMRMALLMKPKTKHIRMQALRERILTYDVQRWADDFLSDLEKCNYVSALETMPYREALRSLEDQIAKAASVVWLFDYDGTLVPFAERPEFAEPDQDLLSLLAALAALPKMTVHVVSGRKYMQLNDWLGMLPIGLHAEHGMWSRSIGGSWHQNMEDNDAWKGIVRPLLQEFALRTPGALIEEKTASLAFHYRMADIEFGAWQAGELKLHLSHLLCNSAVEVTSGNRVVEVKPHGLNKVSVLPKLLAESPGALTIAAGDDDTDEDLFRMLPPSAYSINIGERVTSATIRLPHFTIFRGFLRNVLREANPSDYPGSEQGF